ncbi:MAG TPA: 2-dehydropantoate 2-reductase [Polyangiaceae bacterium]|nr:2-dehydropantoate 2-reductase [Polyangiaceae bacterium]
MKPPSPGRVAARPRVLVVGAGAIGGVVAGNLARAGHDPTVLTTNPDIARSLRERGFRLTGKTPGADVPARAVAGSAAGAVGPFDVVFLATQPPQVEEATGDVLPLLAEDARVVCFQNGLCEERVAKLVGRERVVGAVVAWGASMREPGVYERTSEGGFTLGRLEGQNDAPVAEIAEMLRAVGPVKITENLLGARWSKLAINAAISTLGTIGGDRVGVLMRHGFVRRLVLEIMTETVLVARALRVRLEKVAGTVDLDWLALTDAERRHGGSSLVAKHAVLLAAGFRYRKLRSSMLAAIERGRPPAVDFLNGEVVLHGERARVATPVNRAAQSFVWQIARRERSSSLETLRALHRETR